MRFKEITTSIQQGHINLIKAFYIIFKIIFRNKSFLTFYSSKNPEKQHHGFHKNIKQNNCFQYW